MNENITSPSHGIGQRRNLWGAALILICLCTCASASVEKHSPFAAVPRGHWAYKAYKQLVQAGIAAYPSICFPSSHGYRYDLNHRTLTRYEFAVVTQRALATLKAGKQNVQGRQTAHQIALQSASNKLAGEFRWELAQLNRR